MTLFTRILFFGRVNYSFHPDYELVYYWIFSRIDLHHIRVAIPLAKVFHQQLLANDQNNFN